MATDIIARGMASKAAQAAKDALDELAMVVEGTMNAAETEFTDLDGNVVTPDQDTVYQDVNTYVYYRWNGSAYYTVSDPRNTLKYTVQSLTDGEKTQARTNIGAASTAELSTVDGKADKAKEDAAEALSIAAGIVEASGLCRTGSKTLALASWSSLKQTISITNATVNDYVHIIGATDADALLISKYGITYALKAGGIEFTATTLPEEAINLQIAIISGAAL